MERVFLDRTDEALVELARMLEAAGYDFTTITPASHRVVNARPGNAWARGIEDVFGWSRPYRAGALPETMRALLREAGAEIAGGEGWRSALRLSRLEGHLFWHSAFPTVEAEAVFFGPDTYRFAAAIEQLLAVDPSPVRRAVDLGCGAGPGAVLVAKARPGARVGAADINPAALRLTRVNAALAGAENVEPRESDLLGGFDGEFDLIVANPPYLVDPAERAYRHGGGPLGAEFSRRVVETALERLAPGGALLLYTGVAMSGGRDPFRAAVAERLAADRRVTWAYREVDPDVFGEELSAGVYVDADRIAAVVLTLRVA